MNLTTIKNLAEIEKYGSKAHWLSWLFSKGYNVPFALFFPAYNEKDSLKIISNLKNDKKFQSYISKFITASNSYSVAIRSSGTNEDTIKESKAGHFKSFVGDLSYTDILTAMEQVVKSNQNFTNEYNQMGVIIQKKIDAKFSGVIFSSNIFNASKNECIVSIIKGMGEQLVSGKKSGEDLIIAFKNAKPNLENIKTSISKESLEELIGIAKKIEVELNFPIDIEWCIDAKNILYILQCRPITSLNLETNGIREINLENKKTIPKEVVQHDKVDIRLFAQQNSIKISKAYLVYLPFSEEMVTIDFKKIHPSKYCKGFSVVSLFPKTIKGKIIRHFAEKEIKKQSLVYRSCQRYQIRTYENKLSLETTIAKIADYCFQFSWLSILIIQEIFEPEYTGIIKKDKDGYLVELGKGHFIPKGVVPTSQYLLNKRGEIIFETKNIQPIYYNILNGKVEKIAYNKKISIEKNILKVLLKSLKPILNNKNTAIEFGILFENKIPIPYLIDLIESNNISEISSKLINEGIISQGQLSGKLLSIKNLDKLNLDLHFHNKTEQKKKNKGKYIFLCDTPDIALLELINTYYSQNIGFIFKSGSVLAHLSIILREKKIPAIVNNKKNIENLDLITIDTISDKICKKNRIKKSKGYVFPYINPDTDGVCSALAFNSFNLSFYPVIFGKFDNETKYILNHFQYDFPDKVSLIEKNALIVIVDTHHTVQLPTSINFENIIEIIDHHPTGNIEKFPNAEIQNEKVGAACTLIAERMQAKSIVPDKKLAGIMGLAIISNTLNFTAPSTSNRDKQALKWLRNYCEFHKELIIGMFKARSNFLNLSNNELVTQTTKIFNFNKKTVGICQIEMIDVKKLIANQSFISELEKFKRVKKLDYFLFSGVDIYKQKTFIKINDKESKNLMETSMNLIFNDNDMSVVNRILLRKTDFVPKIQRYL